MVDLTGQKASKIFLIQVIPIFLPWLNVLSVTISLLMNEKKNTGYFEDVIYFLFMER